MNSVKVVHGNPSQEELAAVLAVLLSVGQEHDAVTEAEPSRTAVRAVSWSRGGRTYPVPATSWKFAS
ncbi:acyl-CoA carboxylase subunit epsilon [Streptomyces sp. NPDC102270]|uniref:acyl-CoA carboxylase subunit epsilon n=1 Tax=Streptomyces sp. NPDC102270 TaxID=3366150 RepID=UPI0037F5CB5A